MDLHLLFRTAGVSVSFGEVSCQVTIVLQIHFIEVSSEKFKVYSMRKILAMEWKHPRAWGKVGCFSLGNTECIPSMEGKKGAVFLFPLWGFLLPFHFSKKSLHFLVSHLCFSHSMLPILHLTFTLPVLNSSDVCLDLTPPLCFFCCIYPLFQELERSLGFTYFAESMLLCHDSLLSCLRWELRQGMDSILSVRLHTPHCSLSFWEHRGLGFVSFGLECVEFEGEGGSSQGVHRHEEILNQNTIVCETAAHCHKF